MSEESLHKRLMESGGALWTAEQYLAKRIAELIVELAPRAEEQLKEVNTEEGRQCSSIYIGQGEYGTYFTELMEACKDYDKIYDLAFFTACEKNSAEAPEED